MMTNIFLSMFGISVSISLIVAVLILLTSFLNKRYAAKWKYLIWIVLALRLLIPFSGANGQSMIDMRSQMKTQTAKESSEKHTETPADETMPFRRVIVEIPEQMTTPIPVPIAMQPEKSNISITLLDVVAFVWIIGSLIFISIHFISYLYYKRQVMKEGTIIKDIRILRQMIELKRELHINCTIQTIEYSQANSPMIIGFLKPVLVLPKEQHQYSSEELFFILKHELVHLKRGDTYFKLLFVAANAVHWFNPFIWIMQKEAVVDMELSCDERVTQNTNYAVRKAYTETLLSMLHKQCTKKTVLSTQFYEGKTIMKRRFQNILIKRDKKNGIFLLICAVILTISLGTLIDCSIAKEDAEDIDMLSQSWKEEIPLKQMSAEDSLTPVKLEDSMSYENSFAEKSSVDKNILEKYDNTTVLTFSKEGEIEEKQATLVIGDGYSLYLPDDEWKKSDSDLWIAAANRQVRLWITHVGKTAISEVEEELAASGYMTMENHKNHNKWKQEEELIYHVRLQEFENDVWSIYYCYPADAEEGFGRELPVIADTFAVSVSADNRQINNKSIDY